MSWQPPPSYGGPPSPYGVPPGRPPGMSNKLKFFLGALLAVPAAIVAGIVAGLPGIIAGAAGVDDASSVTGPASVVLFLLEVAGLVALIAFPRTRWWGIGLLAGLAVAAILLAGACVVILAVFMNSYS